MSSTSGRRWEPVIASYREHVAAPGSADAMQELRTSAAATGFDVVISAAFRAVCHGGETPFDAARELHPLDSAERLDLLCTVFEFCAPLRILSYPGRGPVAQDSELATLGIAIDALQRTGENHPPRDRIFPYHETVLRERRLAFPSPLSGRTVFSSATLFLGRNRPLIAFHFVDGGEPFFLFTNSNNGCWYALLFPERDLMLSAPAESPRAMAMFRALVTEFAGATVAHLNHTGERPLAIAVGMNDHLGLSILNEYEAYRQCADAGLLDAVDAVLQGNLSFVPHAELFPEIAALPVLRVGDEAAAFAAVVDGRFLVTRPTCNYWFSVGLRERLRAVARLHVQVGRPPNLVAAERRRPLLWVEIRSNDRRWVDQEEQLPRLIDAVAADHPDLGIVLAGWSRMADDYSYDPPMIQSDRTVAENVRRLVTADVPVFDIAGVSTLEKFAWAFACDIFVSTFGTGLVFPCYAAGLPGVLHANRAYKPRSLPCEQTAEFRLIDHEHIVEEDPDDPPGERNHLLGWQPVYAELTSLLG